MKYNIEKVKVQYIKNKITNEERFFRGTSAFELSMPIGEELENEISSGVSEIIEREEDMFVEELIGMVIPLEQYKKVRRYPKVQEQLDMLWHEINTTGALSDSGNWFNTIKEIKDNHPKPSN